MYTPVCIMCRIILCHALLFSVCYTCIYMCVRCVWYMYVQCRYSDLCTLGNVHVHVYACTNVHVYLLVQKYLLLFLCTAQSALLIMDSEGYISLYTLPDLRLICREDCVDATDAVGQRNFVCSSVGVILHQRSPSEFTRDSLTEEARLEVNFSVPLKTVTPLKLTPATSRNNLVDQLPTPLDMQVMQSSITTRELYIQATYNVYVHVCVSWSVLMYTYIHVGS